MSSVPNPSNSESILFSRLAKMLYPNTAGIATLSAAAVAMSASATPGATAPMFPDPLVAIPMKALMTPSTVPRRPMSGLTDPMVASQGMKWPSRSRAPLVSLSSTSRSASTCDPLNLAARPAVAPSAGGT